MTDTALTPTTLALIDLFDRQGMGVTISRDQAGVLTHVYASPGMLRMLGASPSEVPGPSDLRSVADRDKSRVQDMLLRLREGAEAPPFMELTMSRRDGTDFPVEATSKAIADGDGRVYVTVMRDLSAASAPLSMLEADRVALVGALAAGVAHEINNPLTYVLLQLRNLRRTLLQTLPADHQAAALRSLDDAAEGAERIRALVRAAISITAPSATPTKVDLAAVVIAALRLVGPALEDRARIVKQVFPVPAVEVEESRVGQAVLAMLLFSGSGFAVDDPMVNRIVVSVEARDRHVVVEIADNGSSLSEDECRRAFDPRFSSAARGAGVGVGLAVARSVANGRGGEVTLGHRAGGGLVLTMSMPLASS